MKLYDKNFKSIESNDEIYFYKIKEVDNYGKET